MILNRLIAFALFATLALCGEVRAQWVQTNGPFFGVRSLVCNGTNVFAGTMAGFFLSTDNGATWKSPAPNLDILSLVGNGSNLFVGANGGIFLSTDSGGSWTERDSGIGNQNGITALAASGSNLFAGITGGGTGHNIPGAVVRSTDNGTSWTYASIGIMDTAITAIVFLGTNVFVGSVRGPNDIVGDVYRSIDSGITWTNMLTVPFSPNPYFAITAFAGVRTILLVGTYGHGIYRSTDSGRSWNAANTGLMSNSVLSFAVADTTIFAGTGSGVFYSIDSGNSWHSTDDGLVYVVANALAVNGTNLFAGTDNAVWRLSLSQSGVTELPSLWRDIVSYPNPFTQSTEITITTEAAGYADVTVVNLLGAEVAHLFSGTLGAGEHRFAWNPTGLPDGAYECLVRQNGQVEKLPMMLMR